MRGISAGGGEKAFLSAHWAVATLTPPLRGDPLPSRERDIFLHPIAL